MKEIVLSVIMITYNHELYIKQAIESVLNQKVNFEYEILVGDDASTDYTVDIVRKMEREYPERIRLFENKKNVGASKNLYNLFMHARGKYVTRLEGDDYWELTPNLQKSIDFLDQNNQYIGISRANKNFSELRNEIISISHNPRLPKNVATYETWRRCIGIGTPIYRNFYKNAEEDFSVMYKSGRMATENALGFLLMTHGNVYMTDEPWEVKRCDRIATASNYNTIYSRLEIAKELVSTWDRIEEMYPQYDYQIRRKSPLLMLFYECKNNKEMDFFWSYIKKFALRYRLKILSIGYYKYICNKSKEFAILIGSRIYHLVKK